MILFTNGSRNLDNMMTHFLGKVPRPPICIKAWYVNLPDFSDRFVKKKSYHGTISCPERREPNLSRVGDIIFETQSRVINLICLISGGVRSSTS